MSSVMIQTQTDLLSLSSSSSSLLLNDECHDGINFSYNNHDYTGLKSTTASTSFSRQRQQRQQQQQQHHQQQQQKKQQQQKQQQLKQNQQKKHHLKQQQQRSNYNDSSSTKNNQKPEIECISPEITPSSISAVPNNNGSSSSSRRHVIAPQKSLTDNIEKRVESTSNRRDKAPPPSSSSVLFCSSANSSPDTAVASSSDSSSSMQRQKVQAQHTLPVHMDDSNKIQNELNINNNKRDALASSSLSNASSYGKYTGFHCDYYSETELDLRSSTSNDPAMMILDKKYQHILQRRNNNNSNKESLWCCLFPMFSQLHLQQPSRKRIVPVASSSGATFPTTSAFSSTHNNINLYCSSSSSLSKLNPSTNFDNDYQTKRHLSLQNSYCYRRTYRNNNNIHNFHNNNKINVKVGDSIHCNSRMKKKKKNIQQSVQFAKQAFVIPVKPIKEMAQNEIEKSWWQKNDYENFRKISEIIATNNNWAHINRTERNWFVSMNDTYSNDNNSVADDTSEQQNKDNTNNYQRNNHHHSTKLLFFNNKIFDAFQRNSINKNSSYNNNSSSNSNSNSNKWWRNFGHSRRGLERLTSLSEGSQREAYYKQAVKAVLDEQNRQRKIRAMSLAKSLSKDTAATSSKTEAMQKKVELDTEKIRIISIRNTITARDLAYATGLSDADIVKNDFNEQLYKSREYYLLHMRNNYLFGQ